MRRIGEVLSADRRRAGGLVLLVGAALAAVVAGRAVNPPVEEDARGVIAPEYAHAGQAAQVALRKLNLLSDKALIFYRETKADVQNPETFDPNRSADVRSGVDSATYTMVVDGVEPSFGLKVLTGHYGPTTAAYEVETTSDVTGTFGVAIKAAVVGNGGDATMYSYDIKYGGGEGVTMERHFVIFDGAERRVDDVEMHAGYPWGDAPVGDTACATVESVEAFMGQASDMLADARAGNPVPAPFPFPR